MNVKLAAQVLSSTVSNILREYISLDAASTSTFCLMMDQFFGIMNVRNTTRTGRDVKPFAAPFTSVDDPRFSWLKNECLF